MSPMVGTSPPSKKQTPIGDKSGAGAGTKSFEIDAAWSVSVSVRANMYPSQRQPYLPLKVRLLEMNVVFLVTEFTALPHQTSVPTLDSTFVPGGRLECGQNPGAVTARYKNAFDPQFVNEHRKTHGVEHKGSKPTSTPTGRSRITQTSPRHCLSVTAPETRRQAQNFAFPFVPGCPKCPKIKSMLRDNHTSVSE